MRQDTGTLGLEPREPSQGGCPVGRGVSGSGAGTAGEMIAIDIYMALSVQSNFISIISLLPWNNPGRLVILLPPFYRHSFLIPQCLREENQRSPFTSQPPLLPGRLPGMYTAQMACNPQEGGVKFVSSSQVAKTEGHRLPPRSVHLVLPPLIGCRLPRIGTRSSLGSAACLAHCWGHSEVLKVLVNR